ncbi:MAG: LptA/OstA family protein [Sphingomonas sp.]
MMRVFALLALTLGTAVPAAAQNRHNSDAPIDVASDHIELQDRAHRALLTGNVVIKQAEMTLAATRVTVTYSGDISDGSPQATRLDAAGGVTVTRPDQVARSQYAVYDINRRLITMVGAVTLHQGTNNISGARLSINLDTGRATIDGSGVGGSSGSGSSSTPGVQSQAGRVTGRFTVPKRQGDTPQPTPTPAPKQ